MKTLNATGLKVLKAIHLLSAIGWTGAGICMLILLFNPPLGNADRMYMYSRVLKILDDYVIIPSANGIIITGILYGIFTKWGFFRYRWLIVKWIITIFMLVSGTFIMGPCINENARHISDLSYYTSTESNMAVNIITSLQWGIVQNILLLLVLILSVFKPWIHKKQHE